MDFYDEQGVRSSVLTSREGEINDRTRDMVARGQVLLVTTDGTRLSTELLQWPTNAQLGPEAVVEGWVAAITAYLEQNGLSWDQVQRVGVAIPGPRRSYGVLERGPNLHLGHRPGLCFRAHRCAVGSILHLVQSVLGLIGIRMNEVGGGDFSWSNICEDQA